jgi:hypothetical protein
MSRRASPRVMSKSHQRRTEGSNRTTKQIKRLGCGFANQTNYERRIPAYATARDAA